MSLSFDPEMLRQLATLLNETGMAEIELEDGERRLRLARSVPASHAAYAAPVVVTAASEPGAATAPLASAPLASADPARHPGAVLSPMVGVAYLAPEPGAPNFVTIGQTVEAGQTILLIEAMKTFNQIKAPRAGLVTQLLVGSGQPVEYGEALAVVE